MASVSLGARAVRWRVLFWAAGVVVVAGGGYAALHHYRTAKAAAAVPPRYITAVVGMGPVAATVTGSGSVQPTQTDAVNPQVSGTVSQVEVSVGQAVKAGDPLFQLIDTSGLAQQVTAAQTTLAQAEQQLQQDENPAASVDPRTVQAAQLRVSQAQSTLQQAQTALVTDKSNAAANAVVSTPVAGTVESVAVVAGQQVGSGASIAVIEPTGAPTIVVSVPEEDLPYLPVGTSVAITVSATQKTVGGTVTAVASTSSGQAAVGPLGQVVSGGAGTSQQALYDLTVTPSPPLTGAPSGADATVTFTPRGTPPANWEWSATGTVTDPAPVTVTAQQAGTVSGLVAADTKVTANQQLATVDNPNTATTLAQDQYTIQQDQLSLQQAQLSLAQAQSPTPATPETIAQQQATVQTDTEDLKLRQQALAELHVAAPMAGTVTAVNVQPGQQVGPSTSAVTIESAGQFQAVVSVSESDISQVASGEPVTVTLSALPNSTFNGTVSQVSPTAQTSNGVSAYNVTIDIAKPTGVRAGMSASATITTKQVQSTLRVPTAAVRSTGSGQGTVRLLQNGQPTTVAVKTGLATAQWTQILSGVQPGQSIVLGTAAATTGAAGRGASGTGGRPGGLTGVGFPGGGGFPGGPGPQAVVRGG